MKKLLPLCALAASVCLAADAPPATAPGSIPVETPEAAAPAAGAQDADQAVAQSKQATQAALDQVKQATAQAKEITKQALEQANRASKDAWKSAQKAFQMAQSKFSFQGDEDAPDVNVHLADGEAGVLAFRDAFGGPGRASAQPLIVRTSDLDAETLSNIQEDLTVMSRILTKTVEREFGREGRDSAMGIVLSTVPSRRPQSVYLEGYGALFLVNVKFPLVPPSAKEDEKAEKATDSAWEKTKQELYGSRPGTVRVYGGAIGEVNPEYSAEQVDSLKKDLLESLKNAANIRNLKPDESVTIAVIGTRAGNSPAHVKHVGKPGANAGRRTEIFYAPGDGLRAGRESMLTLRVKKSDIDAFGKNDIDLDQFKKRVTTSAY